MNVTTLQLLEMINNIIANIVGFIDTWGLLIFIILCIIFVVKVIMIMGRRAREIITKS